MNYTQQLRVQKCRDIRYRELGSVRTKGFEAVVNQLYLRKELNIGLPCAKVSSELIVIQSNKWRVGETQSYHTNVVVFQRTFN